MNDRKIIFEITPSEPYGATHSRTNLVVVAQNDSTIRFIVLPVRLNARFGGYRGENVVGRETELYGAIWGFGA